VLLSELLAYLDAQDEHIVMQAVQSMYEDGSRGIFCEKFIPYSDLYLLGYKGVRQFLTSMYEIDEHFLLTNKGELENLKSKIKRLKGEFSDGY
jgi:hypothetical protein